LAAWRDGFVVLGELTQVTGFDDRDDLKNGFMLGVMGLGTAVPNTTGSGTVTFPDGSTRAVALVGARTAYEALVPHRVDSCPPAADRCAALVVTAAELGTTTLLTNRGQATVPAWRFSVAGMSQPILRVAVAPAELVTPPAPDVGGSTMAVGVGAGSLLGVSGNEIRYQLLIGACDTEPRGLLHEESDIVVVGGVVTPPQGNYACTANIVATPVTVRTTAPVGARPIVDVMTGQAVVPSRFPTG
jgi:hypothetical protein